MNAHTNLAQQIADEAGAPQNVGMIERQLVAKREHYAELTETARQIEQDREAALAPFYARMAHRRDTLLVEAKAKAAGLTDEQRVRLAIYLIDSIDAIGADLRVETESCLAEVLSGVRT